MLKLVNPTDLLTDFQNLYNNGLPPGTSSGFENLDPFYSVSPGYWSLVTGIPSHGKSTFLDCVAINLMRKGWKFIIYSPETQPLELHLAYLCQKYLERPFRKGFNERMEARHIAEAIDFFEAHLRLLKFDDGAIMPSLTSFQEACDYQLENDWDTGNVGVILDPWNQLDHMPIAGMVETQMINWELMRWGMWIQRHKRVHGFIGAHPSKPQKDKNGDYKDVYAYDVSGSSAWYNKADHILIVRRREDHTAVDVEKCRFQHLGKKGIAYLQYNSGTTNFYDQVMRNGYQGRDEANSDCERIGKGRGEGPY